MAIGARTRPQVIVWGAVNSTREFKRREDSLQGGKKGDLLGTNIEVETDGGPVLLTAWASTTDAADVPTAGEVVAIVAGVDEAREAQLVFIRHLSGNDLDLLASQLSVPAKS